MFNLFFRTREHSDRKVPEAVLNGKGVFVSLIILVLYQFVLAYPLSYGINWFNAKYSDGLGYEINLAGLNLALQIVAVLLMLFFFGQFYWENLKNYFKDFKVMYLWLPIVCYLCTFIGNIVVNIILFAIRGNMEQTSNNELVGSMVLENPLVMVITTVVLAPFVEETIFRAGLCRPLTASKNYFIKFVGYVLSVGLFALLHVYQFAFVFSFVNGVFSLSFNFNEFISILSYIPMALGFAICASISKNFWVSVGMHMLTNAVAVGVMFLMAAFA